ncbi:hypothetical protein [Gallionella capsiferriformans]|uniref:Uncharacterized protein n=1 Tax=Gallionella capsiferriformans (strain ES-2) TaxID=395494 RepID=D9SHG0_GALCS|nr:hypothetical protein [Gallionella capsiferriformans]ADL55957.1 hypothetical protein Galf_1951 [Gallionella capsiferriformans ES-2]
MKNKVPDEAQIQELVRKGEQCLQPLAARVKSYGFRLFIRLSDGREIELHLSD